MTTVAGSLLWLAGSGAALSAPQPSRFILSQSAIVRSNMLSDDVFTRPGFAQDAKVDLSYEFLSFDSQIEGKGTFSLTSANGDVWRAPVTFVTFAEFNRTTMLLRNVNRNPNPFFHADTMVHDLDGGHGGGSSRLSIREFFGLVQSGKNTTAPDISIEAVGDGAQLKLSGDGPVNWQVSIKPIPEIDAQAGMAPLAALAGLMVFFCGRAGVIRRRV